MAFLCRSEYQVNQESLVDIIESPARKSTNAVVMVFLLMALPSVVLVFPLQNDRELFSGMFHFSDFERYHIVRLIVQIMIGRHSSVKRKAGLLKKSKRRKQSLRLHNAKSSEMTNSLMKLCATPFRTPWSQDRSRSTAKYGKCVWSRPSDCAWTTRYITDTWTSSCMWRMAVLHKSSKGQVHYDNSAHAEDHGYLADCSGGQGLRQLI